MSIHTARYQRNGKEKVIEITGMNKRLYDEHYRGSLFCPTLGCPAKVSYIRGSRPHFRTWRNDLHAVDCIHRFERTAVPIEVASGPSIRMNISHNRKQHALDDAFNFLMGKGRHANSLMTTHSRPRKKNVRAEGKKQLVQLSIFDGEINEEDTKKRGKRILKRYVSDVARQDVGEVRLVMGTVYSVEEVENRAILHVRFHDESMRIVCEENFFKERLNSSYISYFHLINKEIQKQTPVYFTGIGEIRERKDELYELVISLGSDFRINNNDLSEIARKHYTQHIVFL